MAETGELWAKLMCGENSSKMGTETLFFKLFKINENHKHWVTTIISYPANSMVALLPLTPLIWKVWPLHQMMMQLNPRQLKEIELKRNIMTLVQVFPFLSSGGFISHVPESTLRVSYYEPYVAFITHQHFFVSNRLCCTIILQCYQ